MSTRTPSRESADRLYAGAVPHVQPNRWWGAPRLGQGELVEEFAAVEDAVTFHRWPGGDIEGLSNFLMSRNMMGIATMFSEHHVEDSLVPQAVEVCDRIRRMTREEAIHVLLPSYLWIRGRVTSRWMKGRLKDTQRGSWLLEGSARPPKMSAVSMDQLTGIPFCYPTGDLKDYLRRQRWGITSSGMMGPMPDEAPVQWRSFAVATDLNPGLPYGERSPSTRGLAQYLEKELRHQSDSSLFMVLFAVVTGLPVTVADDSRLKVNPGSPSQLWWVYEGGGWFSASSAATADPEGFTHEVGTAVLVVNNHAAHRPVRLTNERDAKGDTRMDLCVVDYLEIQLNKEMLTDIRSMLRLGSPSRMVVPSMTNSRVSLYSAGEGENRSLMGTFPVADGEGMLIIPSALTMLDDQSAGQLHRAS